MDTEHVCSDCGEPINGAALAIRGLPLMHLGICPSRRPSPDDARVICEIEDQNLLVHVRAGGLL